jgi:hypothetical protein
MELSKIIEGLSILYEFYENDDYHLQADEDAIYLDATDKPLDEDSIVKMVELGWHQEYEGLDMTHDFIPEDYDPSEDWVAYT